MSQVVIASRLSDGLVVFLSTAGGAEARWVLQLDGATLAGSDEEAAARQLCISQSGLRVRLGRDAQAGT